MFFFSWPPTPLGLAITLICLVGWLWPTIKVAKASQEELRKKELEGQNMIPTEIEFPKAFGGEVVYDVLNHACVRIAGSKVLYFDPFKLGSAPHDADYVFITHSHYDHESPEDIEKVSNGNTVQISYDNFKPGMKFELDGIEVETVAAYNIGKDFHPKENGWLGYVVKMDGTTFYVAGDTDNTPQARAVKCDIAFLPVGGTYTCTAEEAAELAKAINPAIEAVPYHYGSIVGDVADAERFLELINKE